MSRLGAHPWRRPCVYMGMSGCLPVRGSGHHCPSLPCGCEQVQIMGSVARAMANRRAAGEQPHACGHIQQARAAWRATWLSRGGWPCSSRQLPEWPSMRLARLTCGTKDGNGYPNHPYSYSFELYIWISISVSVFWNALLQQFYWRRVETINGGGQSNRLRSQRRLICPPPLIRLK